MGETPPLQSINNVSKKKKDERKIKPNGGVGPTDLHTHIHFVMVPRLSLDICFDVSLFTMREEQ